MRDPHPPLVVSAQRRSPRHSHAAAAVPHVHIWLPCLLAGSLLLLAVGLLPYQGWYDLLIVGEWGVIENGTVMIALAGAVYAWRLFRSRRLLAHPIVRWWYLMFVLGLLLLAGEETSWGQQWFGWATPTDYAVLNQQGETNLHNMAGWTEQAPKVALAVAVLVGGVIAPLHARLRGRHWRVLDGWLGSIWPPSSLWPSAVIAIGLWLIGRILIWSPLDDGVVRNFLVPLKEGHELFLVLFITLYLRDAWLRTLAVRRPAGFRSSSAPPIR
jgi:hypothetical protein